MGGWVFILIDSGLRMSSIFNVSGTQDNFLLLRRIGLGLLFHPEMAANHDFKRMRRQLAPNDFKAKALVARFRVVAFCVSSLLERLC